MHKSILSCMIEEAIPSHLSSATRLAPQDIYKPEKVPLKGKTEMTRTDRNRVRRKMKLLRKVEHKREDVRMKTLAKLDPKKQGSYEKREALKTLSRNKNVTILPHASKKLLKLNRKNTKT